MDLVHKMMKKRKWGVRGDKQRQGDGMGYTGGRVGVGTKGRV